MKDNKKSGLYKQRWNGLPLKQGAEEMCKATWTNHGWQQFKERVNLTEEELISILDNDLVVLIGSEMGLNGSQKLHRLLYSLPDKRHFIAVQDSETGEIITVLLDSIHNRWRISPEAMKEAEALVTGENLAEQAQVLTGRLHFICYMRRYVDRQTYVHNFHLNDKELIRGLLDFNSEARQELFDSVLRRKVKRAHSADYYLESVFYSIGSEDRKKEYPLGRAVATAT